MDITNLYGILLGLICFIILAICLTRFILRRLPPATKARLHDVLPRRRLLLILLFGVINFIFVTLSPQHGPGSSSVTIANRLGRIALVNMTLLYTSGRMNLFLDVCGIRYGHLQWFHSVVGIFVTMEVFFHGLLAMVNGDTTGKDKNKPAAILVRVQPFGYRHH